MKARVAAAITEVLGPARHKINLCGLPLRAPSA